MRFRGSLASRIRLTCAAAALGGLGLVFTLVLDPTPAESGPPLDIQFSTYCVFGSSDATPWYWELTFDGNTYTGGPLSVPSNPAPGGSLDVVTAFAASIKSAVPWNPAAVDVGTPVSCPGGTDAELLLVTLGPHTLKVGPTSFILTALTPNTPVHINPYIYLLPEPSAALMLASGSLLLWGLHRRRSARRR